MNTTQHIIDLIDRTSEILDSIPDLAPTELNAHPAEHPNSIAWLLWHTGREIDVQLADLTGAEQVWAAGGHRENLDLGSAGDGLGLGDSAEDAAGIRTNKQDKLVAYVHAALAALRAYAEGVPDDQWDEIIDNNWDPPVDRRTRVISIIMDAVQHLAQAKYVAGAPKLA